MHRMFPLHITERGLLYFERGKVRAVCKTSSGRYRAEMCGSKRLLIYSVLKSKR